MAKKSKVAEIHAFLSRKDLMQKLIFSRKISTAIQMAALQTIHILPVTAYSGDEVYWEIPDDLPKMTKLMIDGKALYIHRANFQIIDKALLD